MPSREAILSRSDVAIEARVGGVLVIHNLDTGQYVRLNESAALVWEQLREPATVDDLAKELARHYGIPLERAQPDAAAVAEALIERGLLEDVAE